MFDGVAKAVKGAPVAEGGVTGNHAVFFAHQHGITGYLPGFEPGNTVVGIDGFVVPDGGGMDDRVVVDFSDCCAIVFAAWRMLMVTLRLVHYSSTILLQ